MPADEKGEAKAAQHLSGGRGGKPPKLYDLTTLQRETNRMFGYTAKQTLDYAQSLYEKKLLTYPRTDSRYLTGDMAETASVVLHLAARVPPFEACPEFFPDVAALVNDKKVSDHHALIPTLELEKADVPALPVGERNILPLVCCKLLCAAAEPFVYEAVMATFDCGGHTFTAKGKQEYLDTYEATHDYDEYHFDLDEIEHDPYVLLSILSALHEGVFTLDEVQGDLEMLFEKQYILTETVTTETRYRTETRTDNEGNEYEVEVPYTWYICTVTLENFDLSHVPVYIMGEDQLSMYAVYMSTLGNRPDLFPSSGYVGKYIENPPTAWDIPAEYLTDERFATLITEAEKYLGYPYVWGGSSPETSFDCSGFVSYVLTRTGLCNTGRLGAQGLYNISTPVSDPQPGDLVFFVGTYDTSGISHVGIYVGDGMMLHCGDPISYTNLNTSYWQSHFYAYARPPYN